MLNYRKRNQIHKKTGGISPVFFEELTGIESQPFG